MSKTGVKVLAFGDPGQLGPFDGSTFFDRPNATLKTIHRQALESAIIRQAHAVRLTGKYEPDGKEFQCCEKPCADDYVMSDVVLCHTHRTRCLLNLKMRRVHGFTGDYPERGELIVCLKNSYRFGIFNGAQYEVLRGYDPQKKEHCARSRWCPSNYN